MSEPRSENIPPDPHELLEVLPVHVQPAHDAHLTGQDRPLNFHPSPDEILDVLPVGGPSGGVPQANAFSWHIGFWVALVVVLAVWMRLLFAEGELQLFAFAGLEAVPFLLLTLVTYGGQNHDWAKIVTVALLSLLALLMTLANLVFALLASSVDDYGLNLRTPMALRYFLLSLSGSMLAVVLGALCYLLPVRRFLARFLGLDPTSFVHATALAVVVGMTAVLLVPLVAVGTLPIDLLPEANGEELDQAEFLRSQVYGLVWLVPAAFLAVGYPLRRNLRASVERLALVLPSGKQVIFAAVTGFVLVPVFLIVDKGIGWLWEYRGWTPTNQTSVEELFNPFLSPVGAIVIGVVAGLGEELVIRGMLQPRLGIFVSNLFFTALHAWQYRFDGLLVVFLIGLILGFIRKYSNTSTAAIVHGGYDFWLTLAAYLKIPGFT